MYCITCLNGVEGRGRDFGAGNGPIGELVNDKSSGLEFELTGCIVYPFTPCPISSSKITWFYQLDDDRRRAK